MQEVNPKGCEHPLAALFHFSLRYPGGILLAEQTRRGGLPLVEGTTPEEGAVVVEKVTSPEVVKFYTEQGWGLILAPTATFTIYSSKF